MQIRSVFLILFALLLGGRSLPAQSSTTPIRNPTLSGTLTVSGVTNKPAVLSELGGQAAGAAIAASAVSSPIGLFTITGTGGSGASAVRAVASNGDYTNDLFQGRDSSDSIVFGVSFDGIVTATQYNGISLAGTNSSFTLGSNVDLTADTDGVITAAGNTFNGASQLIRATAAGKYPALDGSLITNLSSGFTNPMTTLGDFIYGGASGAATRIAGNTTTTRKFLNQTGNGTISATPVLSALVIGDISGLLTSAGVAHGSSTSALSGLDLTLAGAISLANIAQPSTPTGALIAYSDASNRFGWVGSNGFTIKFAGIANTANRVYTLPDAGGTLVLNDNTATLTGKTLDGGSNTFTNLPAANLTGTLPAISGVNLTALNGSNIASGTVAIARLASGTPTGSKFIRDDGVLAVPSGGAATTTQIDVFTSSGTYTKPAGAVAVYVQTIGGGGGGGSGRKGLAASARSGGAGGAHGGYGVRWMPAASVGATETVTVGAGGPAGAAQATNSSNGVAGTAGGNSSFGTLLSALGGTAGSAGTTSTATPAAVASMAPSAAGGANSATATAAAVGVAMGGSGGAGGGISSADSQLAAAAGGGAVGFSGTVAGGAAGTSGASPAAGTAGTNGAANLVNYGSGGGGGGSSRTAAAGAGGAGGTYGGGGGGGGAGEDGVSNSGAGGNGGAGIVYVLTLIAL